MAAITILEIATRLSEACCISFVEAEATGILFSLIRTCNRSLPHIQLLHGVLLTMSNVAQYEALLPSLATLTGIEVFLDLVQMFRDKDEIFCLVVSLLERIVTFSVVTLVGADSFVFYSPCTHVLNRLALSNVFFRHSAHRKRTSSVSRVCVIYAFERCQLYNHLQHSIVIRDQTTVQ